MAKLKEWIAMVLMMTNFQFILSGEVDQLTMLERMDSVEAVLELHGLKMEYIQNEMTGFKEKVGRLETKDRDILGDLTKLDQKVAKLGESMSSLTTLKENIVDAEKKGTSRENDFANKMTHRVDDQFEGMPTSCKDLQLLGHKLNGFYSIKTSRSEQGKKIETVFCNFQSSPDTEGPLSLNEKEKQFETRIGVVDVKSSAVQFYVKREENGYGPKEGQKITFTQQVLNMGGGFDWKNQWFLVPYHGTYFFSISGSKDWAHTGSSFKTEIGFMVNGNGIGSALSSASTSFGGFSYQTSVKLNAGDKIELFMSFGKIICLHFTGFMLDEDLSIGF